MNPRTFLQNARTRNQQTSSNSAGRFLNAGGTMGPVPQNIRRWAGADGQGQAASPGILPTSQPYVVQVTNNSAANLTNVDVWGASYYLNTGLGTWTAGSWTYNGYTVSSLTPNINYQQLLGQSVTKPFTTGQTIINSSIPSQVVIPVSVTEVQMNGTLTSIPIITPLNIFQQVNNQIATQVAYIVNESTKFTISQLLAGASVTIFFYPMSTLDMSNALAGVAADARYGNPQTQSQTVTLKNA